MNSIYRPKNIIGMIVFSPLSLVSMTNLIPEPFYHTPTHLDSSYVFRS